MGVTPNAISLTPKRKVCDVVFVTPHFSRSIIMKVRIVDFPEVRVAALEHCGPAGLLDESVCRFIEWRMWSGQSPVTSSRTFGIPNGNPDITPPEAFRFTICGETHEAVSPNEFGVREIIIPGGRCVVVRHSGSPNQVGKTIYPIYRDWLPASKEERRDQTLFFEYLSVYPETPQDQWQTDIYIPLQ